MKEREYLKTNWQGFLNHLKKSLDRNLEKVEIERAMQAYISGAPVDKYLEEIR